MAPSQNATESLSGLQLQAIELLLRGQTVTAVAATIGVARETVHRWLKNDSVFVAATNAAKAELQQAATARLMGVWAKAADNVAQAVERGNLKASLIVLRGFGALAGQPPIIGNTDPDELAEDIELAQREATRTRLLRRALAE